MGRDTVEKLYSWREGWRRVGVVRLGVFLGARPWAAGLWVCLNDTAEQWTPREPEEGRLAALAAPAAAAAVLLIWDVWVMRQVVMSTHRASTRVVYLTWSRAEFLGPISNGGPFCGGGGGAGALYFDSFRRVGRYGRCPGSPSISRLAHSRQDTGSVTVR